MKTRIKVDIKSESLTEGKRNFIERMLIDIGFLLIKHAENIKSIKERK